MAKEDMFANKIAAMYERPDRTNRDIYDVWFFLQNNWDINKELIEQRMNMPFKEFLQKCIDALETMPDRKILDGIGELLNIKQKTWAKAKLRKETIFLLKLMLSNEK